jgi:hypothetical protein
MKSQITAFSTGALAFVGSQLLLLSPHNSEARWFLNSGADIGKTLGAVAVAAIASHLRERSFLVTRPVWMATGAGTAMIGYLMAIGPGNLFPIVIAMGLLMVVPTVLVAGYVGLLTSESVERD